MYKGATISRYVSYGMVTDDSKTTVTATITIYGKQYSSQHASFVGAQQWVDTLLTMTQARMIDDEN